jgi:hypothetical protein
MTAEEAQARMAKALQWGGPTHRISDIAALIRDGKAQWWQSAGGDGMIVTEIEQFPLLKAVRFWLIFGDLKECLSLDQEINAWARDQGCTMAVATGRRGWGRAAAPLGWKPHLFTFYKPLAP